MTRKSFTVLWDPQLESHLAEFWNRTSPETRRELTRVSDEIDRTLAPAAESVGRPVRAEPGNLIWSLPNFSFAVAVVYTVHPRDRIVKVLRIHLANK